MKPKYTATDLFKLRKTLKLLAEIDKIDDSYVDICYKNMSDKVSSRNMTTLFEHFSDFVNEKLPGITKNRLKVIAKEYKEKVNNRDGIKFYLEGLHLKNRLLPFKNDFYEKFGKKSSNHFIMVCNVHSQHIYGKERRNGYTVREVK